jgi:pimeloyl-ACP methyl ester carboxylesterase
MRVDCYRLCDGVSKIQSPVSKQENLTLIFYTLFRSTWHRGGLTTVRSGKSFSDMAKRVGSIVGVRQMRALLDYPGFRDDLGQIACPTTVICGDEDRRTSVAAHKELADLIPGSKVCLIKRAGHFTPLEEPQAVSDALLDWLTG